jgi:hypothetical protein
MLSAFSATTRPAVRTWVVSSASPFSRDAASTRRLMKKSLCVIGRGSWFRLNSWRSFAVREVPSRDTVAASMKSTFSYPNTVFASALVTGRTSPAPIRSATPRRRMRASSTTASSKNFHSSCRSVSRVRSAAPERALPSRAAFFSICVAQRPPAALKSASCGATMELAAERSAPRPRFCVLFDMFCLLCFLCDRPKCPRAIPGNALNVAAP